MKKFFPIIIGAIVGLISAGSLIYASYGNSAFGADWDENNKGFDCYFAPGSWEDFRACGDAWDWKDVFSPINASSKPKIRDLYNLVHNKLKINPQVMAEKMVGEKYGITTTEVESMLAGSLITANTSGGAGHSLSQREVLLKLQNIQRDVAEMKELYDMQAEVDTTVSPSEIFANNDLSDSGFDLIYDLDSIETILFGESTKPDVGAPFENKIDTPIPPSQQGKGQNPAGGSGGGGTNDNPSGTTLPDQNKTTAPSGYQPKAEKLEHDVCEETDNSLNDALKTFEEKQSPSNAGDDDKSPSGNNGNNNNEQNNSGEQTNDKLPVVPADTWGSELCPGLAGKGSSSMNIVAQSIGGTSGLPPAEDEAYITPQVAVCFTIEFIKGAVKAGGNCSGIQCEVQNINSFFDQTFQSTLVPNKVTGNPFEPAKCKAGIQSPALDIKIIMINSPVQTPKKDDLIFNKNLLGNWNSFIDSLGWQHNKDPYKTCIDKTKTIKDEKVRKDAEKKCNFWKIDPTYWMTKTYSAIKSEELYAEQFPLSQPSSGGTQTEILNQMKDELTQRRNQMDSETQAAEVINNIQNKLLFSDSIIGEMAQMRAFFEQYLIDFNKINAEVCNELPYKPNS